jgi:hypothetical protein
VTESRDLSELGREALKRARAEREAREAVEDLTRAMRECADAVREMTQELERARMDDEGDEWRAEA